MSTSATLRTPSTTTWSIDPAHSIAEFKVKHMMISNVKGHFPKITGSLTIDESGHANSRVEATIDASSIETRTPSAMRTSRARTSFMWKSFRR
jgi:polyisoprenoid-binding protein YceI